MAILFVIPVGLIAIWLHAETKPDVLRRVVYGSLALITLFAVTTLLHSRPKERDMRRMAYGRLEQALRAGDTNAALAAFEAYRSLPRGESDYAVNLQIVQTFEAAKRVQPR